MSVTAEGWENRRLFETQRVKVKTVLEESQGHAYSVSLIKVPKTVGNMWFISLCISSLKKKYLINHSHCTMNRQGINFIVKKALEVSPCFKNYR